MSLLFDEPLIAGLDYREDIIERAEERALIERLSTSSTWRRSASTAGSATARRRASAGATISTTRASRRPSRFPDWLDSSLRDKAAAFAGVAPDDFVHALLARYDPGAGIGWHKDRDVFEQVVGVSLDTPAMLRFRQRIADRLPPRQPRGRAALGLSAVRRGALGVGAPHHARRSAALLDHLPHLVGQGPADRTQRIS